MACQRAPAFRFDVDPGGFEPPHGAISFAQPVTPEVLLAPAEKSLGIVIYYDPVMVPSSFRASLDGEDQTGLFPVHAGELELVRVPMTPGDHHLIIQASNKSGQTSQQDFHIQH